MITVTRRYHFEAGHYLPKVKPGHKCANQHGHNYEVELTLTGGVRQDGFLIDFFDMDALIRPIIERIDHKNLNNIIGLENPTVENIVVWLSKLIGELLTKDQYRGAVNLHAITVFETKDCWATWLAR